MTHPFLTWSSPYYISTVSILFGIFFAETYRQYYFVPFVAYTIVPVLDQIIPIDTVNPTKEEIEVLSKQVKWKFPIYSYAIAEWIVLIWAIDHITRVSLTPFELIGLVYSTSAVSATGFLISHELFHKRDYLGKAVGTMAMMNSLYMHFYCEHLYGHHKNVSTPMDPATAKYGQSVYAFSVQSMVGGFREAWKIETNFMKDKPWWHNRMIWCLLSEVLFVLSLKFMFGTIGMVFFLVQAVLSMFQLEAINYIRHYGLRRKEIRPGVYEKVDIKHSWNAPQYIQNLFLLKLQRHSDHHENSYKPYQTLCSYEDSPQLPCGYAVCVPLTLIPPAWFAVINPLVQETNDKGKPGLKNMERATKVLHVFIAIEATLFAILFLSG